MPANRGHLNCFQLIGFQLVCFQFMCFSLTYSLRR